MRKQYRMPKTRKEYEEALLNAFDMGMRCGYAVEHTELSVEERILRERYLALIQGKIKNMAYILCSDKENGEIC